MTVSPMAKRAGERHRAVGAEGHGGGALGGLPRGQHPVGRDVPDERRAVERAGDEHAVVPRVEFHLGFGRIVASEIEEPNMLVNMV